MDYPISEDSQGSDARLSLETAFANDNSKSLFFRIARVVRVRSRMLRLKVRNIFSRQSVVGREPAIVSLTTFGKRLSTVFYAIESIGAGAARPHRMILWLDERASTESLPSSLVRLQKRGLEIHYTKDYRSHTKYYPFVANAATFDHPLVTADDDILYPWDWLAGLVKAHGANPDSIWAYRAHRIQTKSTSMAPYLEWSPCTSTTPSYRSFATGVSGVIYPRKMLQALRDAGDHFLECAAGADDVWLHAVAVRNKIRVGQITRDSVHFDIVRGSWEGGLVGSNLTGGNDQQIQLTYTERDIKRIHGEAE